MNASFIEIRAEMANLVRDVYLDGVNFYVSFSSVFIDQHPNVDFFINQTLYLVNKKKPHRIPVKTAVFAVGVAVPLLIPGYVITVSHS